MVEDKNQKYNCHWEVKMNRLKGLACYLSGPIQAEVDFGREWRDKITPFLQEKNVTVFNPLKPIFHGTAYLNETKRPHMNNLVQEERWEELRVEVKEINKWDLRAVDLSSFLIVNYNNDVHMCGTYEEVFLANTQNKPVLMVVKDKKKLPLWMYGRIPTRSHVFVGWDALKDYLTRIDSDPNFKFDPADKKRWLFFAGDHIS